MKCLWRSVRSCIYPFGNIKRFAKCGGSWFGGRVDTSSIPYLVGVSGRLFPAKFEENGSRSELHQSLDHNFMTLKGGIQVNVLIQVSNSKKYYTNYGHKCLHVTNT